MSKKLALIAGSSARLKTRKETPREARSSAHMVAYRTAAQTNSEGLRVGLWILIASWLCHLRRHFRSVLVDGAHDGFEPPLSAASGAMAARVQSAGNRAKAIAAQS